MVVYKPEGNSMSWLASSKWIKFQPISPSDLSLSKDKSVQNWRPTKLRNVETAETAITLNAITNNNFSLFAHKNYLNFHLTVIIIENPLPIIKMVQNQMEPEGKVNKPA